MLPDELLQGPLWKAGSSLPLRLTALLCDLRPRFLPKCRVGKGYRSIARNGRVLLASHLPLADLAGQLARVRFQVWHRAILPGDAPEPYGLVLDVRGVRVPSSEPTYRTRLLREPQPPYDLALDVGGEMVLEFAENLTNTTRV
jgi:hypothetical protein